MNPITDQELIDWVISGSLRLPDRKTITAEELELLIKMENENLHLLLSGIIQATERRKLIESMLKKEKSQ